jgi:hypothetical protein
MFLLLWVVELSPASAINNCNSQVTQRKLTYQSPLNSPSTHRIENVSFCDRSSRHSIYWLPSSPNRCWDGFQALNCYCFPCIPPVLISSIYSPQLRGRPKLCNSPSAHHEVCRDTSSNASIRSCRMLHLQNWWKDFDEIWYSVTCYYCQPLSESIVSACVNVAMCPPAQQSELQSTGAQGGWPITPHLRK